MDQRHLLLALRHRYVLLGERPTVVCTNNIVGANELHHLAFQA